MLIKTAKYSGFCPGVKRAIMMAEKAAAEGKTVTLGQLAHNPRVAATLKEKEIISVSCVDEVPTGAAVVIRAHGLPPADRNKLLSAGLKVIDATCRKVAIVSDIISSHLAAGRIVYLAAYPGHPEANTHFSIAPDCIRILENRFAPDSMDIPNAPSALAAQTTFAPLEFDAIFSKLSLEISDLVIENTICSWTIKAQESAEALARESDLMIIIGGRNSANTAKLFEVCNKTGTRTELVESPYEITEEIIGAAERVGISAGASTSPDDIRIAAEIIAKLGGI